MPSRRYRRGPRAGVRRTLQLAAVWVLAGVLLHGGFGYAPAARAAELLDLGDAPASYDDRPEGPASAAIGGPRLGRALTPDAIDPETGIPVNASDTARGDDGDDGISQLDPIVVGRSASLTVEITVSEIVDSARVCGWIDFDLDGGFGGTERVCGDVAAGADSASLTWVGRATTAGRSYARLRIDSVPERAERPTGGGTGEVEDYAVSFVEPQVAERAELTLTKTASPQSVSRAGEPVVYQLVAVNTGTLELTGVQVTDELPGLEDLSCTPAQPADLAPGDELSCTASRTTTQDDLDFGSIDNFAKVSGDAPGGDPGDDTDDVTALDDAAVDGVQQPRLALAIAADAVDARVGDQVDLTLTARNRGNVTITQVQLSSALASTRLSCRPALGASLAPGETITCTGRYRVRAADVEAEAVVAGAEVRGEAPYGDADQASDDVVATATTRLVILGDGAPGEGGDPDEDPEPDDPEPEGRQPEDPQPEDPQPEHPQTTDSLAATGGQPLWLVIGLMGMSAAGAAMIVGGTHRSRRVS